MTYLVADIGGTYIRLAMTQDLTAQVLEPYKAKAQNYASLEEALREYLRHNSVNSTSIVGLAIAKSGRNVWRYDEQTLRAYFPMAHIHLVNDFAANAAGLVLADPQDVLYVGGGRKDANPKQVRAVIGSGTGLGLAYITPCGEILKTHGGHMRPSCGTPEQSALFEDLQRFKSDGTIPIFEDALAGNGLLNIYKILAGRNHLDCDYRDTHHMLGSGHQDPLVQQALKFYHEILGIFAHEVLAFGGAYGGLYLTGGITDRLIGHNLFDAPTFLAALNQNTVQIVRDDVHPTPVFWVKDEFVSLRGLLAGLRGDVT